MYFKATALCSTEALPKSSNGSSLIIPYLRCYEVALIYVMTRHPSPASDVTHDMHSEIGVVKVQRREERTLFSAEKAALAYLR